VTGDSGQLLAHGNSTLMVLKDARMERGERWPRKFLD
jgi:hypothetical protein